jgi:hypothetical protein
MAGFFEQSGEKDQAYFFLPYMLIAIICASCLAFISTILINSSCIFDGVMIY